MKGVADYERIAVPYPGGHLPGFRIQAKGKERSTFIFHGGYDSFVEEFYAFLLPLTELGFTVIGFDGPGQGGALRQGIFFEQAWEKPAKAVLDHFKLDAVDWLGASCGGYLSIRAAAFEPRIKHIISAGEEVVQLYIGARNSKVERAPRELKAFTKVALAPGEKRVVRLAVPTVDLAYYDSAKGWIVEPGNYEAIVGRHSLDDQALRAPFVMS